MRIFAKEYSAQMELFVYSGLESLASIDFDCLRTLAFVKFHEIPIKISFNGSPSKSPTGFLPYLKTEDSDTLLSGYEEVIAYFQSKGYSDDEYLSSSYICQLETKLLPYVKYTLWGDPVNVDAVRSLYAKRMGFPNNFVYPQRYIKQTQELLQIVAGFSIEDKIQNHNRAELIFNAKSFVNSLNERIEKRSWFLGGQKPSEVDAAIYAALSILLYLPLQNNDLRAHINECPYVMKYIDRIRIKYLLDIKSPERDPSAPPSFGTRVQKLFINKEKGTLSNGVAKVIFGLLTVGSMAFFAISHGLLEIVIDNDDHEMFVTDDDEQ